MDARDGVIHRGADTMTGMIDVLCVLCVLCVTVISDPRSATLMVLTIAIGVCETTLCALTYLMLSLLQLVAWFGVLQPNRAYYV